MSQEHMHRPSPTAHDKENEKFFLTDHGWECAKWNYDTDYETEPCTCTPKERNEKFFRGWVVPVIVPREVLPPSPSGRLARDRAFVQAFWTLHQRRDGWLCAQGGDYFGAYYSAGENEKEHTHPACALHLTARRLGVV